MTRCNSCWRQDRRKGRQGRQGRQGWRRPQVAVDSVPEGRTSGQSHALSACPSASTRRASRGSRSSERAGPGGFGVAQRDVSSSPSCCFSGARLQRHSTRLGPSGPARTRCSPLPSHPPARSTHVSRQRCSPSGPPVAVAAVPSHSSTSARWIENELTPSRLACVQFPVGRIHRYLKADRKSVV